MDFLLDGYCYLCCTIWLALLLIAIILRDKLSGE